jgi:hypothetical protein
MIVAILRKSDHPHMSKGKRKVKSAPLNDAPTERGCFELLASVQAVAELEQADIVFGYMIN